VSHAPANLDPFRLTVQDGGPRGALLRMVRPVLERALRFPTMNRLYREVHSRPDERHFSDRTLDALGVHLNLAPGDLDRLPTTGPVVLVGNHPIGGIDGLAMLAIMRRIRPDSRMIGNYMMSIVPDLREIYFFVDPFKGDAAVRRNLAAMRAAMQWLHDGHMLATFPAGEVASFQLGKRRIVEPEWDTSTARLILKTGVPVVPIYFEGRNSALFHAAGVVHPRLRTLMLPTEMLRHRGQPINVRIGNIILFEQIKRYSDPAALTEYLRVRTHLLRHDASKRPAPMNAPSRAESVEAARIIDPVPPEALAGEIARLPRECELVAQDQLRVYCAPYSGIERIMEEIGRLRELAFRGVGEGTGRSSDLDGFDRHYLHLFVWDRFSARILGSYRMGLTDEIVATHGIEGLYTHTLFRFGRRLIEQMNPCVELGRSFIHPEVQRSTAPLMLLWKGIGQFLVRNPRYTGLIGPVSISAEYSTMSRLLLMAFLRMHKYLPQLGDLIKPRHPPRQVPREWETQRLSTVVNDLEEVDSLVRELESDGKPMPVLLRQYLRLNARLLGFNLDAQFSNVIDGLMFVDVLKIDRRVLRRFMGSADMDRYLAAHAAAV